MTWTADDVPDLDGRTAIVTGANSGIGLETAAALAAAGATVVLACRSPERAEAARAAIVDRRPRGRIELLRLDLAGLEQIAEAATETCERFGRVDLLVNNAGVMSSERAVTADGFELLFGVNHLGHFAYTGRILPTLLATPGARIVTVTSLSHRFGRIRWDDLPLERRYTESRAYARSKLANAMFSLSFQRRLAGAGASIVSLAAHPGFADTDIIAGRVVGPDRMVDFMRRNVVQTAAEGARDTARCHGPRRVRRSVLRAEQTRRDEWATAPDRVARRALDEDEHDRLWQRSEELTGVVYAL